MRNKALREMQSSINGVPAKKKQPRGRERYRLKRLKKLLLIASKIKKLKGQAIANAGKPIPERLKELNIQLSDLQKKNLKPLNNIVGASDLCSEGALCSKPQGNVKYGKRQRTFTWVPTHIWHAKRFHMMKKWGFQIPFSPNQKCFRATSRAFKQGTIAFDTSYYSELIVSCLNSDGVQEILLEVTKYNSPVPQWLKDGSRSYTGWIYAEEKPICPGIVLVYENSVLVRVHPSVYEEFFVYLNKKMHSSGSSIVDCRYAIGSLQLVGPTALQNLGKILHLKGARTTTSLGWLLYCNTNDSSLIPEGSTFAFYIEDPRCWKRPISPPLPPKNDRDILLSISNDQLYIDADALKGLFTSQGRTDSYNDMLSIKRIGHEFGLVDSFAQRINSTSEIPLVIIKGPNETWTVLAPWFWIQPIWSKLVQVPGVKTGGVRQEHQVNFERGRATYPHDFPYLREGHKENMALQEAYTLKLSKMPESKRRPSLMEQGLELTGGDWWFLRKYTFTYPLIEKDVIRKHPFGEFSNDGFRKILDENDVLTVIQAVKDEWKKKGRPMNDNVLPITQYSKRDPVHQAIVEGTFKPDLSKFPPLPVVQRHFIMTGKGKIQDHARIYEIPKDGGEPKLRDLIGFITTGTFNMSNGAPTGIGLINARCKDVKRVLIRNIACTKSYPARAEIIRN